MKASIHCASIAQWRFPTNDEILGGRIERETPTELVTIAIVARDNEGRVVHLMEEGMSAGSETLRGVRAQDCRDLQRRLSGPDVLVIMLDI